MGKNSTVLRVAGRLCRTFISVYPSQFRERYSQDLIITLNDRLAEAFSRSVLTGLFTTLICSFQIARDGLLERFEKSVSLSSRPSIPFWIGDLFYALRSIRSHPGLATGVVLTLAIGIGASTTIFSVVNSVLVAPLPYPDSERIVELGAYNANIDFWQGISLPNYRDMDEGVETIDILASSRLVAVDLLDASGPPARVAGAAVSSSFFTLFGMRPAVGTFLNQQHDATGSVPDVVISHRLWQQRWRGASDVIGKSLELNGTAYTVIGVATEGFIAPEALRLAEIDIWMPQLLPLSDRPLEDRSYSLFQVAGRLADGAALADARAELVVLSGAINLEYPPQGRRSSELNLEADILFNRTVGSARSNLLPLVGAVTLLLVVACTNVLNLLLARANDRSREIALRTALGASRGRIVSQFLVESTLLAALGAAGGVILASAGVRAFTTYTPGYIPRINEVSLDGRALLFAVAVALVTGLIIGIVPAFQSSNADHSDALKQGAQSTTSSRGSNRIRQFFVVGQTALALILSVGAGLLVNSFVGLSRVDVGFSPDDVTYATVHLGPGFYDEVADRGLMLRRTLTERVEAIPGVRSVSTAIGVPVTPTSGPAKHIPLVTAANPDEPFEAGSANWVGPNYFESMDIPLLDGGREFEAADMVNGAAVVLINETLARAQWPGQSAVGKQLRINFPNQSWSTVVGVVGDVRTGGLDEDYLPTIYFPDRAALLGPPLVLVINSSIPTETLAPQVAAVISDVNPSLPVGDIRSMTQHISNSLVEPRFYTLLVSSFAAVATLLAVVGIYSTLSYAVGRSTREIGLRLALGAGANSVLRMVVGKGMLLVGLGLSIGLVGSVWMARYLEGFLYGVGSLDPATFTVVIVAIGLAALVACTIPAHRASRTDPMEALRVE